MWEFDDLDLDRATMRAWRQFRDELADHVVAMEDDDVTVVEVESCLDEKTGGAAPYVQFCAHGDGLVRAEVSSNEYLDAEVALGPHAEATLLELGWEAPTHAVGDGPDSGSANFHLDAGRREGDRLAAMAVAALREVFGVPHPAFLAWPPAAEQRPGAQASTGDDDRSAEPLAVMPESHEHLRELVGAALTPPDGPAVEHDEDGDIPLAMGSALLYVRVGDAAPVVELFAFVARGVREVERAPFEVAVLNRDTRIVKFVLLDDAVLATLHLPAAPFAPRQLRGLVSAMAEVIDRVDDDLVARLGGLRGADPQPEDEPGDEETAEAPGGEESPDEGALHPALQTLLQLDPDGVGDVEPELAASVCDFDRDLVLALLKQASAQERTWRTSIDAAVIEDDPDEADARGHEGYAWRAAVETLRSALRLIVERRYAEATSDGLAPRDP